MTCRTSCCVAEHVSTGTRMCSPVQDDSVSIKERHLGLHMPTECGSSSASYIQRLADLVSKHLDLDALLRVAADVATADISNNSQPLDVDCANNTPTEHGTGAPAAGNSCSSDINTAQHSSNYMRTWPCEPHTNRPEVRAGVLPHLPSACRPRIAVARDEAFCFYYYDNFSLLQAAGAELVAFSPIRDPLPDDISGVYFGGGYPEEHASSLTCNKALMNCLAAFAKAGGLIYAECGGLMYLSKEICLKDGKSYSMVGIFPCAASMRAGKMHMGYIEIEMLSGGLFPQGLTCRGQVYHFSEMLWACGVNPTTEARNQPPGSSTPDTNHSMTGEFHHAYSTCMQTPIAQPQLEGYCYKNVLASYVHLHFGSCPVLAESLVARCRSVDVLQLNKAVAAARQLQTDSVSVPPGSGDSKSYYDVHHANGSSRCMSRHPESSRSHSPALAEGTAASGAAVCIPSANLVSATSTLEDSLASTSIDSKASFSPPVKSNCGACCTAHHSLANDGSSNCLLQPDLGPIRIASLLPSGTEILYALEVGHFVIGVSDFCDYPQEVGEKPRVVKSKVDTTKLSSAEVEVAMQGCKQRGESPFTVDVEWLRSKQPNLVLTQDACGTCDADSSMVCKALQQAGLGGGITKVLVLHPKTLSDMLDDTLTIANAVGAVQAGMQLVQQLHCRLNAVTATVMQASKWPKVLSLEGLNPLVSGGQWLPDMKARAGGKDLWQSPGDPPIRITWQQVCDYAPEVLIACPCSR